MVFGTFDGLHKGHLDFLKQAREYGDYLVAVVGREKNIIKLKGKPQRNEQERLSDLRKCPLVDQALLGNEGDPYKIIEDMKPYVICLGYDQKHFADNLENELKKRNLNIKVYRMKRYKTEIFHSSILNKK